MKRFATHRVYNLLTGEISCFQVIELDEYGTVSKLYPFSEEIRSTEWLPGLIVLSPCPVERLQGEYFSQFKERMVNNFPPDSTCRAYWLTSFNVTDMEFTEGSHFCPLV